MSFFEWLGRVIMLVLAGMITLSIIGAIAAIPSGTSIERLARPEQPVPDLPASQQADAVVPAQPPAATEPEDQSTISDPKAAQLSIEPKQAEAPDPARWLEVIAYALLALAGLVALGLLLVWRNLRRVAAALEIMAGRPS